VVVEKTKSEVKLEGQERGSNDSNIRQNPDFGRVSATSRVFRDAQHLRGEAFLDDLHLDYLYDSPNLPSSLARVDRGDKVRALSTRDLFRTC